MFDPNQPPPEPGMVQTMGAPIGKPSIAKPDPTGGPHQPSAGGVPGFGARLIAGLPGGGLPDPALLRAQYGDFQWQRGPGGGFGGGGFGGNIDALRQALAGFKSQHGLGHNSGQIDAPGPGNLPPGPAVSGPAMQNPALGALSGIQQPQNGAFGSQYGVVGATPAASPYGLPTY